MTTVVPKNLQVSISLPSGEKLMTNLPQIAVWVSAVRLETKGMTVGRGRSTSAMLKEALQMPKSTRRAALLDTLENIQQQAKEAYGIQ